jgi:hypothetical protein
MRLSLDEIYRRGLEALREKLGRVGMIRFLQQFETGHGDYATERHEWVDETSLGELRKRGAPPRSRKRRPH